MDILNLCSCIICNSFFHVCIFHTWPWIKYERDDVRNSNKATTSYFHILSIPLLTKYTIMQHNIVRAIDKIIMQDLKIVVFWNVTPCTLVHVFWHSTGSCCIFNPAFIVRTTGSPETLVLLYHILWCHIINILCRDKLKYHVIDTSAVI